ncbi:DUF2442 domain-containing protein [Mucilaginibacter sp.]
MAQFTSRKQSKQVKVTFDKGLLFVEHEDGKQQAFPLEWYPLLQTATEEQLADWSHTPQGIHFNQLNVGVALI